MKPTLGSVAVTASINNTWTRLDVPALAFLEKLWLSSGRADVTIDVRMRVNGIVVEQPLSHASTIMLPPDVAVEIPDVYYVKHSATPTVLEFQASAIGAEITFVYFERLNPVPVRT